MDCHEVSGSVNLAGVAMVFYMEDLDGQVDAIF
jgi:hypothetical protein